MSLSDDVYNCCPFCGGQGYTIITGSNGEPEQEQCRFCYEIAYPLSKRIAKLEAENQRLRNALEDMIETTGERDMKPSEQVPYQLDGEPCSLYKLVRKEPDWAVSRINYSVDRIAELEAEVKALKLYGNKTVVTVCEADILDENQRLRDKVADWQNRFTEGLQYDSENNQTILVWTQREIDQAKSEADELCRKLGIALEKEI